jgi:hypothetical protein
MRYRSRSASRSSSIASGSTATTARITRFSTAAACVEDINYKAARGLDKRQIAALAGGKWIRRSQNLLITRATGSGKTWLACPGKTGAIQFVPGTKMATLNTSRPAQLISHFDVPNRSFNPWRQLLAFANVQHQSNIGIGTLPVATPYASCL